MTMAFIRIEGAKRLSRWCICPLLAALVFISGCTRSVTWEEEVPLNTGETIWVKRSGTYSFSYSAGSGHVGYSPDWKSTIEFTYKGKKYSFTSDVGLVLLAIAPDGLPNLVADPRNNEWHWKNNYYCVSPYYVQFRPENSSTSWIWPEKIEPWLYGLRTNLILGLVPLANDGKRYADADREQIMVGITGTFPEFKTIDIKHTNQNTCPRRK